MVIMGVNTNSEKNISLVTPSIAIGTEKFRAMLQIFLFIPLNIITYIIIGLFDTKGKDDFILFILVISYYIIFFLACVFISAKNIKDLQVLLLNPNIILLLVGFLNGVTVIFLKNRFKKNKNSFTFMNYSRLLPHADNNITNKLKVTLRLFMMMIVSVVLYFIYILCIYYLNKSTSEWYSMIFSFLIGYFAHFVIFISY